jgi:hypothetical protein
MRVSTMPRLLAAAALAGSFVVASVGAASASPPNWKMTVTDLPGLVHNGNDAGYRVTINNVGPSNISTLFLVTQTQDSPSYVSAPTQGTCSAAGSGPLSCDFGALTAGSSVTVTVAYTTPATGTSYDPVFQANSNGVTFSDQKKTSHGDTLQDPNETPTALTTSKNFAGGFSVDGSPVTDDTALSKTNLQSTSLVPPQPAVIATVEDGLADGSFACTGCSGTLLGEWSRLNVNNDQNFGTNLIKVSVLIYGKSLPKSVDLTSQASLDQVNLVHVLKDGSVVTMSTRCPVSGPTLNCVTATAQGSNLLITGYTDQNGGVRGIR